MYSAPTLDRLRQSLSNVTWRETLGKESRMVVALNDQGSRIPFFCVHSLTGKATDYVPLAQRLGPDQPFFALQIPPAHRSPDYGGLIAPLSIPAIAAHYVAAIESRCPAGPLALGGWSIGAIIALEMARQFKARGRAMALLTVFDMIPWNHGASAGGFLRALEIAAHAPFWLASHRLVKQGGQWRALAGRAGIKLASLARHLAGRPSNLHEESIDDLIDTSKYAPAHVALMEQLFECACAYAPGPYDGPVQVYAASTEVALSHLSTLRHGWRHIAAGARVTPMPGAHHTLFNGRDGDRLAAHLGARLARFA